ncbi:MAG: glycine cleavage system protein GcvH [Deltaproteobacteria bacterium]|nr:glycine cleavage system protein GcvH [Deltaproteobacteria bacterium]
MEIEGYFFPDDLWYDKNHFWARIDGDQVVMGTTDFAQKLAGDIGYVEIPEEGQKVQQGKPFGSIESGKWVGRIYAVFSGKVTVVNEALEDEPELINSSPYDQGWICQIAPENLEAEKGNLMPASELKPFIEAEMARVKDLMNK